MSFNKWTLQIYDSTANKEFKEQLQRKAIRFLPAFFWLNLVNLFYTTVMAISCSRDPFLPQLHLLILCMLVIGLFTARKVVWAIEIIFLFFFLLNTGAYIQGYLYLYQN